MLVAALALALLASIVVTSCVSSKPATDLADPGLPFGPTAVNTSVPVAFVQDIKPIFDRDCVECHEGREARGGYSTSSYAAAMAGQRPGDARSSVVRDCAPGGSMYIYFSGDAVAKATLVFRWMVVNDGLQSR